jgi:hypothetical protein
METKVNNISNTCRVLQNIVVTHEYYTLAPCPVKIVPDEETLRIIKRYDLLLKATNANRWLLLAKENFDANDMPDEDKQLHFTLKAGSDMLHYVSEEGWGKAVVAVDGKDATIRIAGREKYLEYICIPKYSSPDLSMKIREAKNRLSFRESVRITLQDIPVALRFVTEEKVKLMQQNEFKVQLWEIRESGERPAGEALSVPRPDSFSPVAPQDTITSYLYY